MYATDAVTLDGEFSLDANGYLVANAKTARTGIQIYSGGELGKPELDRVRVYRDESEVFSHKSLKSFAMLPMTNDHPSEPVTSANWRDVAVGTTGNEVLRDGEHLKIGLKITDHQAIADVKNGKKELSVGYTTDLVWEAGKSADGQEYDARQTSIVANHVAIVRAGRAGNACRIGDSSWAATQKEEKQMNLKTVTVDGIPVEVTDQGATVIATLQQRLSDANKAKEQLVKDHETVLSAKDKELGTKDARITELEGKIVTDAALDKLVSDRAEVIAKAKSIVADAELTGKSNKDIRRSVVAKKLGDTAIKDRSDDYIEALFDGLSAGQQNNDPFRQAVKDGLTPQNVSDEQKAYEASVADLNKKVA